jgi:hypothetical protein
MNKIDLTQEQATALQNAVDEHMDRCYEVIDFEGEELPEYLSDVDIYCGCHVCNTREHLMATFNYLRDAGIVDIAVE